MTCIGPQSPNPSYLDLIPIFLNTEPCLSPEPYPALNTAVWLATTEESCLYTSKSDQELNLSAVSKCGGLLNQCALAFMNSSNMSCHVY